MILKMKSLLVFCIALCYTVAFAESEAMQQFEKANQAYSKANYKEATRLYKSLMEDGLESAELYFNTGNAYFKSDSLPQAILYYEKAKKLDPLNGDISANLKMANLRTVDKIEASEELFIVQWARQFTYSKSSNEWSVQTIISFFVTFSLLCFYLVAKTTGRKKFFFFAALVFFMVSLFSFLLAQKSYRLQTEPDKAVLFVTSAQVRSAPNESATNLFVIHSGIKFTVLEQNGEYSRIQLANGNEGWLKTSLFSFI